MQDLLSYMLDNIVDGPIEVSESEQEGMTIFNVNVPKDQVGMVIGKGGKTINALKNILKIRAIRDNVRVDIQINEA
ncbi:MAG TPA: KH domain-containing protein [Patescibacteria group bacterium]|nr:KH domain-containing protein [Patescibacteria group bacterium]